LLPHNIPIFPFAVVNYALGEIWNMNKSHPPEGLTFRLKMFLLVAAVNILLTGVFAGYLYHVQKKELLTGIDDKLRTSALAVRYILPGGFHDRVLGPASVSPEEHMDNVRKLSRYAKEAGVVYLYSIMEHQGKLVFTSTSATDKELREGAVDPYFTVYDDATEGMRNSFKDKKAFFEEYQDKYGNFRSVIIPVTAPGNRVYLVGADMDISSIHSLVVQNMTHALLAGLVLFMFSMAVSIIVIRPFTASISLMKKQVGDIIESHDLTRDVDVRSSDELGSIAGAVNELLEFTRSIISRMERSTATISTTSENLSANSLELISRTRDQGDAIMETSRTLEGLIQAINRNTSTAVQVESPLKDFHEAVHERLALITDVTDSMSEIQKSSAQIEKIVGVINEIAFQTNLLALNASVEAARAGDAGKGFSVVADEVRSLSLKTALSSRDIQQIVQGNINATRKGMKLVNETSDFFHVIIDQISDISQRVSRITDGCREQSNGIGHINETLERTRSILNRNTDLAKTLSNSGHDLHASVLAIDELIRSYKSA
jgi:methyl-accepting chemotaxis protein